MTDLRLLDDELDQLFASAPQAAPRALVDRSIEAALKGRQQRSRVPRLDRRSWPPAGSIAAPGLQRGVRLLLIAAAVVLATGAAVAALTGTSPLPQRGILAIVRDEEITFANPDGTSPRVVLEGAGYRAATWSPQGRHVAIHAASPEDITDRITVVDARGRAVGSFTVYSNGYDPQLAWSPDETLLLVHRGGGALDVVGIDGRIAWSSGAPVEGDREWRAVRSAAWRPDGGWIAVDLKRERNLCHETILVPTAGDHAATIFRDSEPAFDCSPHRPAWSPDGRQLAMLRSGRDCWPWQESSGCDMELVVYDDAGTAGDVPFEGVEPRVVATRLSVGTRPLWTPAGDEILVARRLGSGRDAAAQLVLVRADGSGERTIASIPTGNLAFDWAVPGRSIIYRVDWVYLDGNGRGPDLPREIRLYDLATGEDRQIADAAIGADLQPVATGPGGSSVDPPSEP